MADKASLESIGPYALDEPLGRGGMAEVYRARRSGPGGFVKDIALKRILPRFARDERLVRRFMDEARIAGALIHGNIVQVNDFGQIDGEYFIAMEYVDGLTLVALMERAIALGTRLPPALVAFVGAEVGSALGYAHSLTDASGKSLEVVHRDVSPQNVMLSFSGDVKLSDFGIAKAADKLARTEAGLLVGKAAYMSPEQARGEVIDGRSDLFALGVVLWEALTLEPLLPRGDAAGALEALDRCAFRKPSELRPDIGAELDDIVMGALGREAADRYPDGESMARALRALVHREFTGYGRHDLAAYLHWIRPDGSRETRTEPPRLPPAPGSAAEQAPAPSPPPARRRRWLVPALSLLLGLASGGALGAVLGAGLATAPAPAAAPPPEVQAEEPPPDTRPSEAERLLLAVVTEPAGARVYVEGLLVGESPVVDERRGDGPVTLALVLPEAVPQVIPAVRPAAWTDAAPTVRLLPTDQEHGLVVVESPVRGAVLTRGGVPLGALPQTLVVRWEVDGTLNPQGLVVLWPERPARAVDLSPSRPWELVHVTVEP